MNNINQEKLSLVGMSREFVGKNYSVGTSIFFVTAPPGGKVRLHFHDYDEIILVQEGRAMCTVGTSSGKYTRETLSQFLPGRRTAL